MRNFLHGQKASKATLFSFHLLLHVIFIFNIYELGQSRMNISGGSTRCRFDGK